MHGKIFTDNEKFFLYELIVQGKSLNQITGIMGRSKSTIYYHFKKIKGRSFYPVNVCLDNLELVGEFMGLFAGDGSFYKMPNYKYNVRLHFNTKEVDYVKNLIQEVLFKLFNKKPRIYTQNNGLNLSYYSRDIYKFITQFLYWDMLEAKTYSVKLRNKNHSVIFMIGFIRGSLDSDGHLSPNKIVFSTVSTGLKDDISRCLDSLKFSHTIRLYKDKRQNRKAIYHISLFKKDFSRFYSIIKPRNVKGMHRPGFE